MEIQWIQKFTMHEIEKMIIRDEGKSHQQVHMDIINELNKTKFSSKKSFLSAYKSYKVSMRRQ